MRQTQFPPVIPLMCTSGQRIKQARGAFDGRWNNTHKWASSEVAPL